MVFLCFSVFITNTGGQIKKMTYCVKGHKDKHVCSVCNGTKHLANVNHIGSNLVSFQRCKKWGIGHSSCDFFKAAQENSFQFFGVVLGELTNIQVIH